MLKCFQSLLEPKIHSVKYNTPVILFVNKYDRQWTIGQSVGRHSPVWVWSDHQIPAILAIQCGLISRMNGSCSCTKRRS